MIIKSTLVSDRKEQEPSELVSADLELLKQEVMEDCKELIEHSLGELKER